MRLAHEEREAVDVLQCYAGTLCHAVQRVFGHMELYVDLVGESFLESAQQRAASGEVDTVVVDVCLELWRSVLERVEHGCLYASHGLVDAVGYLLVAHGHLHGQRIDAVGAVNDEVFGCFLAKVGEC